VLASHSIDVSGEVRDFSKTEKSKPATSVHAISVKDKVWQHPPDAADFEQIAGGNQDMKLLEVQDGYEVSFKRAATPEKASIVEGHLVVAVATMRPIAETLRIQDGSDTREYLFKESRYEVLRPEQGRCNARREGWSSLSSASSAELQELASSSTKFIDKRLSDAARRSMPKIEVPFRRSVVWAILAMLWTLPSSSAFADSSTASLSVSVSDSSGALVPEAHLVVRNSDTTQEQQTNSGKTGSATFSFLKPGHYTLTISKESFADVIVDHILLNVGDDKQLQVSLKIGTASQTVNVDAGGLTINTTDASVSTVVDRKFVENMPLNGRSFQDLISMTPGVVTQSPQAAGGIQSKGDFSVNGQRTESNSYTVDGVSGDNGTGYPTGYGQAGSMGAIAASTALGTTQSLISVDALQEFRVMSSTYSAEYGRTPGGQFSLSTRSGTNTPHGTVFDYLRNDALDSNDWFNKHNGKAKTALRQNDFGGTFGGPILLPLIYSGQDRTFFFISYEGLRLTQPTAATTQYVPSLSVRTGTVASLQPIFNAFPLPTGPEISTSAGLSGLAPFVMPYSLPSRIDSTSIRLDQKLAARHSIFFRWSDAPTSTASRVLSSLYHLHFDSQTYTAGITSAFTGSVSNDLRFSYASSKSSQSVALDNFGGATPVDLINAFGIPGSYSSSAPQPNFSVAGVGTSYIGPFNSANSLRQWNLVDTLNLAIGRHVVRAGIDERHITSPLTPIELGVYPTFTTRQQMLTNTASYTSFQKHVPATPILNEFSAFVQDEWHVAVPLTLSMGLRWELNPPPSEANGKTLYTLRGDVNNPATLSLAPAGTPLWKTSWYNVAPRLGLAWVAHNVPSKELVVRVGGGAFYDTGNQVAANGYAASAGFFASNITYGTPLPISASQVAFSTDPIAPYTATNIYAFPEHLQLPYSLQWNASITQAFSQAQSLTISYVGSSGRRLLQQQSRYVNALNSQFGYISYFPSGATSNYQSLQLKYEHSVSHGLQALISYTWSHSLDYGSTNSSLPLTYGNSDFDVRHNFQGGLTWEMPRYQGSKVAADVLNGWVLDGRLNIRTPFPISLTGALLTDAVGNSYYGNVNYDPSRPVYLYGSQYPDYRPC
jgi:hypothetical protein